LLFSRRFFRAEAAISPARSPEADPHSSRRRVRYQNGKKRHFPPGNAVFRQEGVIEAMATNTDPVTEVLHNDNHSKLSAEQIAKAVTRHNRDHSKPTDSGSAKPKKVKK
jgi:hypothetical protein